MQLVRWVILILHTCTPQPVLPRGSFGVLIKLGNLRPKGNLKEMGPGDSDNLRVWMIWKKKKMWALDTNENGFKCHVFLLFNLEKIT